MPSRAHPEIQTFALQPGRVLAGKYEIVSHLGVGWEGEVYIVKERATGIERAAKLFFPQHNPKDRSAIIYARKLHRLRQCPIIIQYHNRETFTFRAIPITVLISDLVEGEPLSEFLRRQPGRRLSPFQALHLLHALAEGVECIHDRGEYHGDLHMDNIIVQRYGLGFDLKLLDLFHWGGSKREGIRDDVIDLIRLCYDAMGGRRRYSSLPAPIKAICCGLKRTLILNKYKTAGQLRRHLETMQWD